ncbi:hypothetical protein THAOC_37524, partial [Thalassiosira oceanica]
KPLKLLCPLPSLVGLGYHRRCRRYSSDRDMLDGEEESLDREDDEGGARALSKRKIGHPKISDDHKIKRPNIDGGTSGTSDAKIEALESPQDESLLRQQLHWNQGVLPVVAAQPPTVDLSRLDTHIVIQISSFLGTSRELMNLALTSKSFGLQQPASGRDWSLAEEVARRTVRSGHVRIPLSKYVQGRTTWLSILRDYEHPKLTFDTLLGGSIEYLDHDLGRTTTVGSTLNRGGDGDVCTAIVSNYVMESGIHYAEFYIDGLPSFGVVRPMPDMDLERIHWSNWDDVDKCEVDREGRHCGTGDDVGMLLNLNEGTLTAYKNKRRLCMINGLSGSYCWHASVRSIDHDYESATTIWKEEPPKTMLSSCEATAEECVSNASGGGEIEDDYWLQMRNT